MIIPGLSCPCCGSCVLDNGGSCTECEREYPEGIKAVQRGHHEAKIENVTLMREGKMSVTEAVYALPRVTGQSEQKICMVSPGTKGHKTFHLRKKMDCGCDAVRSALREAWEKAAKFFALTCS